MVKLYNKEKNSKLQERLLLIIRVKQDGPVPFHAVKEMNNRSNLWVSYWLKRYTEEGIGDLKNR